MENKKSLAGLASFVALAIAAIVFVVEYVLGAYSVSWANYLLIVKDIAIAIAIVCGSYAYVKQSGLVVKILFFMLIAVYIIFAVLTQIY